MRRRAPSELGILLAPLISLLKQLMLKLHWWLGLLLALYMGSGVTTVQPDEVALILRFGSLQNKGTAQAIHPPGLLWALPKPMDEVLRIKIKKVYQQEIKGLHFTAKQTEGQPLTFLSSSSLDPEKVGYALTGDGNVVHLSFIANYQITDPIAYGLYTAAPEQQIQQAVQSVAVQQIGALSVDSILSDGRQRLVESIAEQSQQRLDEWRVGVTLASLEVVDLVPPYQVKSDFNSVQSAYIEAQTMIQKSEEYKVAQLPLAESGRTKSLQQAKSYAAQILAEAQSGASAFERLLVEYQNSPEVVEERLYREGIERTLRDVGRVQFLPPPQQNRYQNGFRVTLPNQGGK